MTYVACLTKKYSVKPKSSTHLKRRTVKPYVAESKVISNQAQLDKLKKKSARSKVDGK